MTEGQAVKKTNITKNASESSEHWKLFNPTPQNAEFIVKEILRSAKHHKKLLAEGKINIDLYKSVILCLNEAYVLVAKALN